MYRDMANPNPNTKGLMKALWHNTPTVAVRIPEKLKEEIMAFARHLDRGYYVWSRDDCKRIVSENERLRSELEEAMREIEQLRSQIPQSKTPNHDG
jgi:predicted RNase H-like nuclease (RuvC/YqgF family)